MSRFDSFGIKRVTDEVSATDTTAMIMVLWTKLRCEFAVEGLQLARELVAKGLVEWDEETNPRHTVLTAGKPTGIKLTKDGQVLAEKISIQLRESGIIART